MIQRVSKRLLALLLLGTVVIFSSLTVFAENGEGAGLGATGGGGTGSGTISAGDPNVGSYTSAPVFGWRFYVVEDVTEEIVAGTELVGAPNAASVLDRYANEGYKAILGNGSVASALIWDYSTGSASSINFDAAGVHSIPGLSSFTVLPGNYFFGSSYATQLNAAFSSFAASPDNFAQIAAAFGKSFSSYENSAIVCEPVVYFTYADGTHPVCVTYQKARAAVASGVEDSRGMPGAFFNMKTGGGTNLKGLTTALGGRNAGAMSINGMRLLGTARQLQFKSVATVAEYAMSAGYFMYGPGIGGSAMPPAVPDATNVDLVLQDYELNHVYNSMFGEHHSYKDPNYLKVNQTEGTIDSNAYTSLSCGHSGHHYPEDYHWEVIVREEYGSGPIVAADNKHPSGSKLLLKRTFASRNELMSGVTVNTQGLDPSTKVIDYGVNLVRYLFGDERVYSNLLDQTIDVKYLSDVLGLTSGHVPNAGTATTSPKRYSKAQLPKVLDDTFKWSAVFECHGSRLRWTTTQEHCPVTVGSHPNEHSCNTPYNKLNCEGVTSFFLAGGAPKTDFTLTVRSIAYKYVTDMKAPGESSQNDSRIDLIPTTDNNGNDKVQNEYKSVLVVPANVVLTYYPEVPMVVTPNPGDSVNPGTPTPVPTMGEVIRESHPSFLFMYRIKSASDKDTRGTVYSDTAVGGSNTLSTGKVALTAGGDFTVKAQSDFTLNFYGYAMDIIDASDPGSIRSVIKNQDVKSSWGCAGTKEALLNNFISYVGSYLNPANYQADFRMRVGGKTYNSFSATVGGFTKGASKSSEDGVYNLTFRKGSLVQDAGYNEMIAQISEDYGVSVGTAVGIWESSDLASAVLEAIESAVSPENQSQAFSTLGANGHWYDEEVRTIVIRRFKLEGVQIKDIIAQDKLDLGNSAEALNSDIGGSFDLSVYFGDMDGRINLPVLGSMGLTVYRPTKANTFASALEDGTIICSNVHVTGADFTVTRTTTATQRKR